MSSCAKFQNDPFIRSVVSSKNVKRMFLSPEPFPGDFSKILFHEDIVNNGIYLCVEFHVRRPSSFWGVKSQRNVWMDAKSFARSPQWLIEMLNLSM